MRTPGALGDEQTPRGSHRDADRELARDEQDRGPRSIVRHGDQVDDHQDQQRGDRVVQARLPFEGPAQPHRQPDSTHQCEHRRAVGGGEDRAQQQALEQRELEQCGGGEAHDHRRHNGPDHRQ